mgnify:CR=1 FL=1
MIYANVSLIYHKNLPTNIITMVAPSMDFSISNLLAFQNIWTHQPELFSEEARLSLSQIISELEENLEKIS